MRQRIIPDLEVVHMVARGARAMWGANAAEGCRAWGRECKDPTRKAEWLAAALMLTHEDLGVKAAP